MQSCNEIYEDYLPEETIYNMIIIDCEMHKQNNITLCRQRMWTTIYDSKTCIEGNTSKNHFTGNGVKGALKKNLLFYIFQIFSLCRSQLPSRRNNRSLCLGHSGGAGWCSPEESLQVLGQLRAARVAGVHGDEDAHGGIQANLLS